MVILLLPIRAARPPRSIVGGLRRRRCVERVAQLAAQRGGRERLRQQVDAGRQDAAVHDCVAGVAARVDLHVAVQPEISRARLGAGGVHHVAFRTPNEDEYHAWTERLNSFGIRNSGEIEALAASVEDNGDVYIVPAFSGLYAPYWKDHARGVITGLEVGNPAGFSSARAARFGEVVMFHYRDGIVKNLVLRNFRDNYLLTNNPGRALVSIYYKCSPPIADMVRANDAARFLIRIMLASLIFMLEHFKLVIWVCCAAIVWSLRATLPSVKIIVSLSWR